MSDINSSLVGFLKKKSLFTGSPQKKRKNKSKDKTQLINTPITPKNNLAKTSNIDFNSKSSKNIHQSSQHSLSVYDQEVQFENRSMYQESPIRYQVDMKKDRPRRNFNFKNTKSITYKNPEETQYKKVQTPQTTIWSGLVNHATSFESARIQSAQCLDSLATKIHAQISNINYKVDMFNSKMAQILNKQFKELQKNVYEIINHVFEQSQNNIRMYIKEQEEILAGELLMMRGNLQKQLNKVEDMRQEIKRPNWRKVAGELLSTEMQTKIQEILKKSKSIEISQWQVGDLGANKVNALEHQLRDIIKLSAK